MTEHASVQSWARAYIESSDLNYKCAPPAPPEEWEDLGSLDLRPARPPELRVTHDKPRNFKLGALGNPETVAALHHKFWHHELQAAELMCWGLLRFPETPLSFKKGLLSIFLDEVRHMSLYQTHIESLGFALSDFPVRDWFWERVPTCQKAIEFVALLGMGLEGANLEHTARFEKWFKTIADDRAAQIQQQVGLEEVGHVRFAIHWFHEWTGDIEFSAWCDALPPPLTPLLMRGKTIHTERRLKAHFPQAFIDELANFQPERPFKEGSTRKERTSSP